MRGRMCKIGGVVSGEIPGRGGDYPARWIKKHAGWTPIVPVWRHTMRATDGLKTTITSAPSSHRVRRSRSNYRWTCQCTCHNRTSVSRPDRGVRSSGRSRNPAPALPSPDREGRSRTGSTAPARQRRGWHKHRGTRPFTFKTTFGEVTVERLRISHNHDGTIEIPSATVWEHIPSTRHHRRISGTRSVIR